MDTTPDTLPSGDDLSALAWVNDELRRSLEAAHKALRRHLKEADAIGRSDVDAVDPSVLRSARVQLHQGVGALELVGLPGPARLLRASEAAVQRMVAKPAMVDAAGIAVIERSSFALLDYLARQLAGKPVSPIALFPQYRAAQTLAGADRIHPADLWGHDWQWREVPADRRVLPRAADDGTRSEMETLVLGLMRQNDVAALSRMSDLCAGLAAGASGSASAHLATLWQLASAFFEAQSAGLLVPDVYSKRIASRLLAQLRMSARGQDDLSDRLAQDLLFFCAHARAPGGTNAPRLRAVRQAWQLDGSDQGAAFDYETPRLGRFDPAWLTQARKRIAGAKDVWSAVAGGELHRMGSVSEQFSLVGDSIQRLFPSGEQLAQALQAAVTQTVASGIAPPATLAMEVATGVLCLEASIEDGDLDHADLGQRVERLAQRINDARIGVDAEPLEPWMEELYRRVSDRQTMGSVVHELRASLSEVEKQIDQYFRNPAQREVLIPVPNQLSAMRGVFSVLGLAQASQAVLHMRDEVDALAETEVDPQRAVQTGTFDRLADNLGALSFLIDMLSVQPALAKSLFRFDAETGSLSAVMGQSDRPAAFAAFDERTVVTAPPVPALHDQARQLAEAAAESDVSDTEFQQRLERLSQQAAAADESALARAMGSAQSALRRATDADARQAVRAELAESMARLVPAPEAPEPLPVSAPVPPPRPAPVLEGQSGLEDDPEMREIFIEEAREVVQAARASLTRLSDAPDDLGELTALRRAFHTLKGSSRMVGLVDYGEGAWGCEQLFNARLASDPRLDAPLAAFTLQAINYLDGWTEAIAAGRHDGHVGADLAGAADVLRLEGRRVPVPAPGAGSAAAVPQPIAAEPLAAQADVPDLSSPAASMELAEPLGEVDEAAVPEVVEQADVANLAATSDLPDVPGWPAPTAQPAEALGFEFELEGLDGTDASSATAPDPSPEPPADADAGLDFDLDLGTSPAPADTMTLAARVPDLPSAADLDLLPATPAAPAGPDDLADMPSLATDWPELPGAAAAAEQQSDADGDRWADTLPLVEPSMEAGSPAPEEPAPAGLDFELDLGGFGDEAPLAAPSVDLDVSAPEQADLLTLDADESGSTQAFELIPEPDSEPLLEAEAEPEALPAQDSQIIELDPIEMEAVFGSISPAPPEAVDTLQPEAVPAEPEPVADLALPLAPDPLPEPELQVTSADITFELPEPTAAEPAMGHDAPVLPAEVDLESEVAEAPAEDLEPEPEVAAEPALFVDDEQVKVIGPLRIGIPLFNIYLNEADEWSRRLGVELAEWALEHGHRAVPESASALAHSLAGSSATVGYTDLSALARSLEHALMRSQLAGQGRPGEPELFLDTADEIRRLLHQFAAGFLRPVAPELLERLADHERWPVEPAAETAPEGAIEAAYDEALPELSPEPTYLADEAAAPPAPERWARPAEVTEAATAHADDLDAVDAIDPELFPIFDEEAAELLPQLQAHLREWADRPSDMSAAAACMRTLHTFKGGARLSGAMRLGEMAHRLEAAIEHLLAGEQASLDDIEPLLGQADRMSVTFEALRQPAAPLAPTPLPVAVVPQAPPPSSWVSEEPPLSADATAPAQDVAALEPEPLPEQAPEEQVAEARIADVDLDVDLQPSPAVVAVAPPLQAIQWDRFPAAAPTEAPQPAERAATGAAGGVVRVRAALLDRLVNEAGEVSITRARIDADVRQLQSSLGELTESLDRLRRQLRDIELQADTQISSRMEAAKASSQNFDPLEMDRYTRFQELTRFMAESVNDVATLQRGLQRTLQSTEDELAAQARLTRALQDDLLRTRMVEFESLNDRLHRTVRQAARDTGKQARLDIVGGAIEVDRGVLERMAGPFEHLLRNCVAHGIEAPEARAAAGKDRTGAITVTVSHEGNEVGVEVRDDGAGLDLERIRARGLERGLLSPDVWTSDAELSHLIFKPGFSTAATVTELAGRGVGLDVVLAEVNAMGGRIETSTTAGGGTGFRLLLPLTTAVTQVVMLRCGELSVAVPSTLVEIVRRVPVEEVEAAYQSGRFQLGDESLPFFWLAALLQTGTRGPLTGRTQAMVVVRSALQRVALHVDEVMGNQEVVVKNLGPQLSRLPGLAGVTLLPSGVVALIYNPVALATLYGDDARQRMRPELPTDVPAAAAPAEVQAPLVLVVDDSLTVRRVTQRLLLREGYRVTLAKDGMEALERLAEERPVLMLSDIEMPRMDGFDLVRNVRADERLAQLPVIMITSRIAQKHRDYARELGVDHYLGKPFAEDELLALVAGYAVADIPT